MGIKGRVYTRIKEILSDRTMMVKINGVISEKYQVENGITQGTIVSILLFSIMINEIFKQVEKHVAVALFAGDGALWKRRRNLECVIGD